MPGYIALYTTTVSLFGGGILLWSLFHVPADWSGVLLMAGLAAVAEWANVALTPSSRSRVSVSAVVALAGMALFGPAGGVLIHTVSGLTTALTTVLQQSDLDQTNRASVLQRTGFNTGMYVIAIFAAGLIYTALGGSIGQVAMLSNLIPLCVAVVTEHVMNVGLLVGVIALQTRKPPLGIWRENFMWAAPVAVATALVGSAILSMGIQYYDAYGLLLFLLPIFVAHQAYRRLVGRLQQTPT